MSSSSEVEVVAGSKSSGSQVRSTAISFSDIVPRQETSKLKIVRGN